MKTIKSIAIVALFSTLTLTSCQTDEPLSDLTSSTLPSTSVTKPTTSIQTTPSTENIQPKSFSEIYEDFSNATGLTLNGNNVTTIYSQNDNSTMVQKNTMEVKYSSNTFSNHQSGQSSPIILDFFNKNDQAVYYYMNAKNEKTEAPVQDSDFHALPWSSFKNPFKDEATSEFFKQDSSDPNRYVLNLEDKNGLAFGIEALSTITSYSFTTLESFTLKVEDNLITDLQVVTGKNSVDGFLSSITYDLAIDYSTTTDHTIKEPEPFKHESYHDTLNTALETIYSGTDFSIDYSYDIATSADGVYHYEFAKTGDVFYKLNKGGDKNPLDSLTAFIKKEDGLHAIRKDANGSYSYEEQTSVYKNFDAIFNFVKVVPTEAFTKNDNGTYTISSTYARDFETNINPFTSPNSVYEGVVTLNSSNQISSIHFVGSGYVLDYVFKYGDQVKLPFDSKTLPMQEKTLSEVPSNLKTSDGFKAYLKDIVSGKKVASAHVKSSQDEFDLTHNANETHLKYENGSFSYYGLFDGKYINVSDSFASSYLVSDDANLQTELDVKTKEEAQADFDANFDLSYLLLNNVDLDTAMVNSKSYEAKLVNNKVEIHSVTYTESSFGNNLYDIKAIVNSNNQLLSITVSNTSVWSSSDWDSTKHEPLEGKGSVFENEVTDIVMDGYNKKGSFDAPLFDFKNSFIQRINGDVKLGFGFDNNTAKVGDNYFSFELADGASVVPSTAKESIDKLKITSVNENSKELIQFKNGLYTAVKAGVATVTIGTALNPSVKSDVKITIVA